MLHRILRIASLAVLAAAPVIAGAQQHHVQPGVVRAAPAGRVQAPAMQSFRGPVHLDQRYHHDHYYPSAGFSFPRVPGGSVAVEHGGSNWFFHGGVWFRPDGGRYVVARPPVGIVVPFLPPAFVTLWIGGAPYYYANGVYYGEAPDADGYVVVDPPDGALDAQPMPVPPPEPAGPTTIIYPRNGQTQAQTDVDRAACNDWANAQPGIAGDPSAFQRAFAACMDGRGYTLR